jgi:hypothetical protein
VAVVEPTVRQKIGEAVGEGRPVDECPYPKPFSRDFDGCPAYQVSHLVVLDSLNRPLKTIWSCRRMEARALGQVRGRYYGACQLGDAQARKEWAEAIGADRLQAIERLRLAVMPIAQRFVDAMAVLKARQMEARDHDDDTEDIREGIEAIGHEYLAELDRLLRSRTRLLQRAEMPKSACMELARRWVRDVIDDTWGTRRRGLTGPRELLEAFPESVGVFYALPT